MDILSQLVSNSNECLHIISSILEDSSIEGKITSDTPPPNDVENPDLQYYPLPTILCSKFIKILSNFMNYSYEFISNKHVTTISNSSIILVVNLIKALNLLLNRFCQKFHNYYGIFNYDYYIKEFNHYYFFLNEIYQENKEGINLIPSPQLKSPSFSFSQNSSTGLTQNLLDLSSTSSDSMQIVTSIDDYDEYLSLSYYTKKFYNLISLTEYNLDSTNKYNIINNLNVYSYLFWIKNYDTNYYVTWSKFKKKFELEYGKQTETTLATLKSNLEELIYDKQNNSYKNYVSFKNYTLFFDDECSLYHSYQEKCNPNTSLVLLGCLDENIVDYPQPTIIKQLLGIKISSISCGDQHIAVVSDTGGLYTWGKGAFGRLGHGSEDDLPTPCFVKSLSRCNIVRVSCGFAFTAAVTNEGELYTWGAGMNGRLGHNDYNSIYHPKKVEAMESHIVTGIHILNQI